MNVILKDLPISMCEHIDAFSLALKYFIGQQCGEMLERELFIS